MKYAEENEIPFIDGKTIVENYREFKEIKKKIFV
jgi:hypothetical protein